MDDQTTDKIWQHEFISVTIGKSVYNVNRKEDEVYLLTNFEDIIPCYSSEYGVHIRLSNKNINKPNLIVPLRKCVLKNLLIPDASKLSDEEFFKKFVEIKKPIVENIIKKVYSMGYENPSSIQAISIVELVQGRDALIQSKSGTGKTLAFLLGLLWGFDPNDHLQYIFITISHEVAKQIYDQIKGLMPENTKIVLCIGQKRYTNVSDGGFKPQISTSASVSRTKTIREEKAEVSSAQIIVCTMGKFFDFLFDKKWINMKYVKGVCVDEFDTIVASRSRSRSTIMNTEEQFRDIIKELPEDAQRTFFSATVSERSLQIAHDYFRRYSPDVGEPLIVLLDTENYTLEGIRQYYVQVPSFAVKKDVLIDLIRQCRIAQAIVFVNNVETANEVKYLLDEQEIPISSAVIHGRLSETERNSIFMDLRSNKIRILISTDLTSRGIDVQSINLIINFDMPDTLETYIHRIGRSGRYGRKGVAISMILVNHIMNEMKKVESINEVSKNNKMEYLPSDLANLL
ncbi:MAG: DEAD/DEAH box helicase [Thermoplasmata archaeon]